MKSLKKSALIPPQDLVDHTLHVLQTSVSLSRWFGTDPSHPKEHKELANPSHYQGLSVHEPHWVEQPTDVERLLTQIPQWLPMLRFLDIDVPGHLESEIEFTVTKIVAACENTLEFLGFPWTDTRGPRSLLSILASSPRLKQIAVYHTYRGGNPWSHWSDEETESFQLTYRRHPSIAAILWPYARDRDSVRRRGVRHCFPFLTWEKIYEKAARIDGANVNWQVLAPILACLRANPKSIIRYSVIPLLTSNKHNFGITADLAFQCLPVCKDVNSYQERCEWAEASGRYPVVNPARWDGVLVNIDHFLTTRFACSVLELCKPNETKGAKRIRESE